MLRSLPDARREELRPLAREHFRHLRPHLRKIREHQRELYAALTADPFNPEKLQATLTQMHGGMVASQTASHASFVNFVAALSATERAELAQRMQHRHVGRPKHGQERGFAGPGHRDHKPQP